MPTKILTFFICITGLPAAHAQTGAIQRHITTSDGKPAPYITIMLKGSKKATVSNDNGSFILKKIDAIFLVEEEVYF